MRSLLFIALVKRIFLRWEIYQPANYDKDYYADQKKKFHGANYKPVAIKVNP